MKGRSPHARSRSIMFRVTPAEFLLLEKGAAEAGKHLSDYVRTQLFPLLKAEDVIQRLDAVEGTLDTVRVYLETLVGRQ